MASFLLVSSFAPSFAGSASEASQTVAEYLDERCPTELASFKSKVIAQKDIWDRFAATAQESLTPDVLPVATWYAAGYPVITAVTFTFDAQKMSAEKRAKVADRVAAAMSLMKCLTPTATEWSAFDASRHNDQTFKEAREAECIVPWAERFLDLLRGDLNGDALKSALALTRAENKTICQKKG
jgi:hypothetical protein